ncbi:hypothetical protein [Aquabacterium sp. CECT 9606]|uniref:hypothetical protein n=1 Tax=Aquabacterium sp. CECT 9606 TaxID=2845822 RepID=UPI001E3014B9|nr:hypothetical protein [Aquabacterium sp. CECT 9606]CAH0352515.1 hypothetical protein AQB9606_02677 [Aquabacterium sp. CECT 9606]
MNKSFGLGIVIALAACSANAAQIVGGTPSFTAVRAQIETAGCPIELDPSCLVQATLGGSLQEAGSEPRAYSQVRAGFGVNGAYASVNQAQDREAYAESIWSDAFVVHGGSGQATAQITVRLEGTLDGLGQPGGPGSNSFYTLFVSDKPISCDFDELDCTGNAAIPLTESLSGVQYLSASIEFTYDKPFYLASYLGAEVVGGQTGVADFFHSAHFGISAPIDATLTTDSGTRYQAASSVPEPQSVVMFAMGMLVAWRTGSKRARHP